MAILTSTFGTLGVGIVKGSDEVVAPVKGGGGITARYPYID